MENRTCITKSGLKGTIIKVVIKEPVPVYLIEISGIQMYKKADEIKIENIKVIDNKFLKIEELKSGESIKLYYGGGIEPINAVVMNNDVNSKKIFVKYKFTFHNTDMVLDYSSKELRDFSILNF